MKKVFLIFFIFLNLKAWNQSKTICVANACKQTIVTTDSVQVFIQVTTSDPTWAVAWKQVAGAGVPPMKISTAPGGYSGFTLKKLPPGTYIFSAAVTSSSGIVPTVTDTVIVMPLVVNVPPVANAGVAQAITLPVNNATLTGSGTDVDGTIASYAWSQIGGPSIVSWTNITPAITVVGKLVQGTYTFQLIVTDNQGATGKAITTVTVNSAVVKKLVYVTITSTYSDSSKITTKIQ